MSRCPRVSHGGKPLELLRVTVHCEDAPTISKKIAIRRLEHWPAHMSDTDVYARSKRCIIKHLILHIKRRITAIKEGVNSKSIPKLHYIVCMTKYANKELYSCPNNNKLKALSYIFYNSVTLDAIYTRKLSKLSYVVYSGISVHPTADIIGSYLEAAMTTNYCPALVRFAES